MEFRAEKMVFWEANLSSGGALECEPPIPGEEHISVHVSVFSFNRRTLDKGKPQAEMKVSQEDHGRRQSEREKQTRKN